MIKRLKILWLRFIRLRRQGFQTWDSWSGFGVTTKWPKQGWEKEVGEIYCIFSFHLPHDWVIDGPHWADGKVMMYAWPRNDPHVKKRLADRPIKPLANLINDVKKVKVIINGKNFDRAFARNVQMLFYFSNTILFLEAFTFILSPFLNFFSIKAIASSSSNSV
jgi:hypothetical protein